MTRIASICSHSDWLTLDDIDIPLFQRALSAVIDESLFDRLVSSAPTTRSRALALSTTLPHAFDWINVVPSPSLGLHLLDREFRSSLCYWLGVPLHNSSYPCPKRHLEADTFGDHQISCGGNGDHIYRHNAIHDVVYSAAQSAALGPTKESPDLIPNSAAHPADVFLPNWSSGRPAALDIHVISPLQPLTIAESAITQGHALNVGIQRKLSNNLQACRSVCISCIPLVVESLGGLSKEFIDTISSIGKSISLRFGCNVDHNVTKHLFGRVGIALWRGNAALLLHGFRP